MSRFRVKIRSRHPSHDPLRTQLPMMDSRAIVRLGSLTPILPNQKNYIEVNTVDAIYNSANKLLMKRCFTKAEVKTALWCTGAELDTIDELFTNNSYVVAKHIFGSRGTGNYLIKSKEQLEGWMMGKTLENYIFEKFYNYNREYRLHVTKDGCFYTCRKLLREDTPVNKRWFRNDSNSIWVVEENPSFDKPANWDAIVAESVKALNAVGLDFGAVDVRVQSSSKETKKKGVITRENPEFIVIEINSAPSFGEITLQKYLEQIPKIINSKV